MINKEENEELKRITTKEEGKRDLFVMHKDNAPRSDHFQEGFFQSSWDIVCKDVVEEVVKVFKRGKILKSWNDNFLVLSSKKKATKEIKYFIPVRLCNVIHKIVTIILSKRLKHILPNLISK